MTERAGFYIEEKAHLTAADVEDIHNVAEKEGFDQGFKKGYDDGYQSAKDEQLKIFKQQQLQVGQLLTGLKKPFEELQNTLLESSIETVFNICNQFLKIPTVYEPLLESLVHQAVELLIPQEIDIKIHIPEAHIELVSKAIENLVEPESICIQVQKNLTAGNVLVECGYSHIHINIDEMIQAFLKKE